MSKYSRVTDASLHFVAGSNISDILKDMWDFKCEGASEVQATVNEVRVIMIDERLFKTLGKVNYK